MLRCRALIPSLGRFCCGESGAALPDLTDASPYICAVPIVEGGVTGEVLIVVPAWNEAAALPIMLAELRRLIPSADVLVVNDGSTDATSEVVREAGERVVDLPYNIGVGGAMRTGFLYAARRGYGVVIQLDADGQHDPSHIAELVDQVRAGVDVVIGSRFAGVGDYPVHGPRRWAMRLLAISLSILVGHRLTDVTSGFRAAGPRAIALFARNYPPEYLGDTVESLVLAHRAGLTIAQVPVAMRSRVAGTPSQSVWRAGLYLGRALLVLALALIRSSPAESAA